SQRVRSLGKNATAELERCRTRHCFAMETLPLSLLFDDDDEFCFTRHAGHVSDLSQAGARIFATAGGGHRCDLQYRRFGRRHSVRAVLGPLRASARDGYGVSAGDRDDSALGLRAEYTA